MPSTTALSIGAFDGVHLAHATLVREARSAVGAGGRVVVLTFDPHPATVLRPDDAPPRLSTLEQRRAWLATAGADEVVALRPTAELLRRSPERFIGELVEQYRPGLFVEGPDFRFGHERRGSVDTLRDLGATLGFEVRVIEPVMAALSDQHVVPVSSTMIRWLLRHGRVRDAAALLGRPYELVGTVVAGARQGRELSMPTANLEHGEALLPADGVYAGRASAPDGTTFPAAISVGTKPTFGTHARLCETHLIGYDGPLDDYGWTITIRFAEWLREQLSFDGIEALVAQMQRDVTRAKAVGGGAASARPAFRACVETPGRRGAEAAS